MQYNYIANVLGYDYLNTEYMQTLRTIYPSKKDRFLVRTSYMEIYNERLLDLMVYTSVCDCVIIHTIVLHNHYTAILYMYVHEWLLSRVHFDITMCTCTV